MRVSQKADYALRAMFELARKEAQPGPVRTSEIAAQERLPEKFLEGILVELRKAGLITSVRGKGGGHRLARDAGSITIGEVWRAVDGSLTSLGATRWDDAKQSLASSALVPIWKAVFEAASKVVDAITLAEFVQRAELVHSPLDYTI